MVKNKIIKLLKEYVGHDYVAVVKRGNSAINSALSLVDKKKKVLIPAEGGWIHYRTAPKMLGLDVDEVVCHNAKLDLVDLHKKLATKEFGALLYQNPGGYFAEQDTKEIKKLGEEFGCLVILDVSGAIGTNMCRGEFADVVLGSFGKWKLVEAHIGGFISVADKKVWAEVTNGPDVNVGYGADEDSGDGIGLELFDDEFALVKIYSKLKELPARIQFLSDICGRIVTDLKAKNLDVFCPNDMGFVVVVKFDSIMEKETIINYCSMHNYEFTECPRYIRLNQKAISIEVKRLQEEF